MFAHVHRVGIAAHLGLRFLYGLGYLLVGRLALEVFQLNDIGMFHIGEYLTVRTQEDVGIAALVVQLGYGTVEAALAGQGQRVAVHEGFALLAVTL